MIELYKFAPQFEMRDASPFALKLETYLRLAGLDYTVNEVMDPSKAPKAKIPYIVDGDKTIADSSLCISYLKATYGDPLGAGLSSEQHAIGHAVKTMLEERTYWVVVNNRWMDTENQKLIKSAWFGAIPAPIRGFIFGKIIKDMKKGMYAHGIGRHTAAEIMAFGVKDIQAFEAVLGKKAYLLGDNPSEYDASGYGFLANIMAKPFPTPMSEYIAGSKTLSAYIERVAEKAFG
jgi:glutathione S-transferase